MFINMVENLIYINITRKILSIRFMKNILYFFIGSIRYTNL